MADIIDVRNLTVEYMAHEEQQTKTAVNDVSLSIEEGSFTAVIGRNGSGKSTLAKTMNALILPTEGKVFTAGFDTADPDHLWDIRQNAGMVFQNPDNQLVSAIVEDDVAFGPENIGVEAGAIRKRVDEALLSVDMYDYRKKAPHMLSGGQKQRIAIAGIIAMKPACIIFDEPTAMLDPKGRKDVLDIIHMLHDEGITVVLITHFMEEAVQADNVVILDDGKIAAQGSPSEVFSMRDVIKRAGLEMPFAADVAQRLNERGIPVGEGILYMDELVEAICRLK